MNMKNAGFLRAAGHYGCLVNVIKISAALFFFLLKVPQTSQTLELASSTRD